MVSKPRRGEVVVSVERRFVLGWRDVTAVAVKPLLVEPVDPAEGGELEVADIVPAVGVGSVDALGLVEAVDGLGEGIVERLTG